MKASGGLGGLGTGVSPPCGCSLICIRFYLKIPFVHKRGDSFPAYSYRTEPFTRQHSPRPRGARGPRLLHPEGSGRALGWESGDLVLVPPQPVTHLVAWTSHFPSLNLSFPICKIGGGDWD